MAIKIGIVFNFLQLPDVLKYPFVISKRSDGIVVKKGLFVYTYSIEGYLVGIIEKIILLNEYFSDALTIKAYNNENNPNILRGLFPSDDFEYAIAIVKNLGIIHFKEKSDEFIEKVTRMTYPVSPGKEVFLVEEPLLKDFLGLNPINGLNLGKIKVTELEANIDMDRLLNKHFAILSISGGGKSYLTSIIIEELLSREKNFGTPIIILIDVHGEYTYMNKISQFKDKIKIIDTTYFQIAVPQLTAYTFQKYQEQISNVQIRELSKYIKNLKNVNNGKAYGLND
ncbi:MAG: helicase HerA domain-containing protein, partial [Candidatus Thorarchaeota archaeon]